MNGFYIVLLIAGSYLLGSIPTGYLISKIFYGVDIRSCGSGNPGATNVLRQFGIVPGIITLLIDALKGLSPVLIMKAMFPDFILLHVLTGFAAISGHTWSIFLKLKGGKGVATSAGVFGALLPFPTLVALAGFVICVSATRYVSVGSIVASILLPVTAWGYNPKQDKLLPILATITGILVVIRHRSNIKRLITGEESKIT